MTTLNKPITSREYKLLLKPDRFTSRDEALQSFLQFIRPLIEALEGELEEEPEDKKRFVWYLDTPEYQLRQNKFFLRLRDKKDGVSMVELTLKHRNPDRYLSANEDLSVSSLANGVEIEPKFEEDIVRDFGIKFANSTSVKFVHLPTLQTMADLLIIFPGLASLGIEGVTPLEKVCNFEAFEIQHEIGEIDFGPKPKVGLCLSFWYSSAEALEQPQVAEFSFDYAVTKEERTRLEETPGSLERFPIPVVERAAAFFAKLHTVPGADAWFAFDDQLATKTEFAYSCQ